jgi:hypothetical protein
VAQIVEPHTFDAERLPPTLELGLRELVQDEEVVHRGEQIRLPAVERLAHRGCNTMRGKIAPVAPWSKDLILGDPAPIVETVERLERKGGRELVAQCVTEQDAAAASEWLLDRLSRFAPNLKFETVIKQGGGHYLLQLVAI